MGILAGNYYNKDKKGINPTSMLHSSTNNLREKEKNDDDLRYFKGAS